MHNPLTASPATPWMGVPIALIVMGAWASHTAWWACAPAESWTLARAAWVIPAQTFLYTGLFITAHDAMHGTVAPSRPRLNDSLGALALALYAGFSFHHLRAAHHRHHASPAISGHDPDFHRHDTANPLVWYFTFLLTYLRVGQIVVLAATFNLLRYGLGFAPESLLLTWVVPSLLSSAQLFAFGTWLPHRDPPDHPTRARSLALPTWASFLVCYHFGYHREHHARPGVPWWRLPALRREQASREAA